MMKVKILRNYTGLSQAKFASLFDIPLSTYQDWEHERRTPPDYVVKMMIEILTSRHLFDMDEYLKQCEKRKFIAQSAISACKTASNGPSPLLMEDIERYIMGEMTLDEINKKIDNLKYL